jgi:hypothetical protein
MASLAEKMEAEVRAREMLDEGGLPPPDRVEYGYGCIRFFFDEPKAVVVIDIDDYSEVDQARGIEWPDE